MRHHTEPSFPKECNPQTEEEKIIWLANIFSSVGDAGKEHALNLSPCKPPFYLTHVLSKGEPIGPQVGSAMLEATAREIAGHLRGLKSVFESDFKKGYLDLFQRLAYSRLRDIPADPRIGMNDVSLWNHLKLTAAFATCIFLDGGYKDDDVDSYEFALISGDADKISRYVNTSSRLPDLNARSLRIQLATEKAGACIADLLGPECLIFAGGGGILALSPVSTADTVSKAVKVSFEEATDQIVTITVNWMKAKGNRIRKNFGGVWKEAQWQMRLKKSERPIGQVESLSDELKVCDVCHLRSATHPDKEKILPYNASPRPEELCEFCWKLRQEGHGLSLDRFKDDSEEQGKRGLIAIIRADGDRVGKVLSGDEFGLFAKTASPARLSAISRHIHDACEKKLDAVVTVHGGRCLIAGGDDILAIAPGETSLETARSIASEFRKAMAGACTMSAGIAIFHPKLPIYAGLEVAETLLRKAKENHSKDSVAFAIIGGIGYTPEELMSKSVSHGPWKWSEMEEILKLSKAMAEETVASTQIRNIAETAIKNPLLAEALIKNLMAKGGRGRGLEWSLGERLLSCLQSGILLDAFTLYSAFKER
jgi:CRISPR/Cas system-associated protein Cas10 (large subunit of type III CRISPR-Cas system)